MASRRGACKRKLHFGESEEGSISSEGATTSQQGYGWVASSWEASPIGHGKVVATGVTQSGRVADGCSRTSAADHQHQQPTDAGAAGAAHGTFTVCGFWSPIQHTAPALPQSPAMAANCSPIAASPATLPSAPVKVCRMTHPVEPATANVSSKRGQLVSCKAARVLHVVSASTGDHQQVQDWLTAMGA